MVAEVVANEATEHQAVSHDSAKLSKNQKKKLLSQLMELELAEKI